MKFAATRSFARALDRQDPLKKFRGQFHLPRVNGRTALYFTGNSLGLQPKSAKRYISQELTDWARLGVEGHFHAQHPWLHYHKLARKTLGQLVGAKPAEVVAMNQLTVNLHLMMVSFYRPTAKRYKILTESGAFSSDQYAFESQLRWHGHNPDEALVELAPRPGEHCLRTEDILAAIHQHGPQLALVIFGGVQYYSGQFFKIREITAAAHRVDAYCGFDLAHAIGNVPLALHRDEVDFAVWCSYKYLNAGPGSIAGAFVHEKHGRSFSIPRLAGWWGHDEKARFKMEKGFVPMPGVDGWQLSNFPVLSGAAYLASLQIFAEAGIKRLRQKSVQLTGYLEFLLQQIDPDGRYFTVLTPAAKDERGCQLSVFMHVRGRQVFKRLTDRGVVADWREPNVIRLAPVPLYNSFEDVFSLAEILAEALKSPSRKK
jgi:kynureninase